MGKCLWSGNCKNVATCVPKIYIPAKGHAAIPEQAIAMIAGVEMCRSCCKKVKPIDFVPDLDKFADIAARMSFEHKGGYFNEADVERAWVVPLDMQSEEYKKFKEMSDKRHVN